MIDFVVLSAQKRHAGKHQGAHGLATPGDRRQHDRVRILRVLPQLPQHEIGRAEILLRRAQVGNLVSLGVGNDAD